jgi:hypothetical protein
MPKIDKAKQERDEQISLFLRDMLNRLLLQAPKSKRKSKRKANLRQRLVKMTPEEQLHAQGVMRIFREEDR